MGTKRIQLGPEGAEFVLPSNRALLCEENGLRQVRAFAPLHVDRHKKPETEMGGVAEGNWASDRLGKGKTKRAAKAAFAIDGVHFESVTICNGLIALSQPPFFMNRQ
jgi:hypothetical protein